MLSLRLFARNGLGGEVASELGEGGWRPAAANTTAARLLEAGCRATPAQGAVPARALAAATPRPPPEPPRAPSAPVVRAAPVGPDLPAREGWAVQVGALPSEAAARDTLRKVAAGAPELAARGRLVLPADSGSLRVFRARFTGFTDRAAAQAACDAVERTGASCLVLRAAPAPGR